ncbi:uncharacterized protein AAEQ78_025490 isoform 2-T3 [Lycaon pictus]
MAEDNRFPRPSLPGTQLERSLGQSRSLLVTADRTVGALQPSHVSSRRPHPVLSPLPLLPHPWLERERDVVSQRKRFCLQARQGLSPPHPILVSTRWHLSVTSKTVKRARAEPAPRPVPYAAGTLSTRKSPRSLGPHPWLSGVETNKEPAPGRATARGRTSSQQAASAHRSILDSLNLSWSWQEGDEVAGSRLHNSGTWHVSRRHVTSPMSLELHPAGGRGGSLTPSRLHSRREATNILQAIKTVASHGLENPVLQQVLAGAGPAGGVWSEPQTRRHRRTRHPPDGNWYTTRLVARPLLLGK